MKAKKEMPKRYHLNRPDLAQAVAVELRTCQDVKSQQRLLAAHLAASGQMTAAHTPPINPQSVATFQLHGFGLEAENSAQMFSAYCAAVVLIRLSFTADSTSAITRSDFLGSALIRFTHLPASFTH